MPLRRVLLLALSCACATACRGSEPIRVGLVAGLSGRHYDLGVSCRNGAQLAVRELNAAGGVHGRPLQLLVRDDAQDPATARQAVRALIEAGAVAIVGHCTSAMVEATLPLVDEAQVVMVSPTVASPGFLGRDDWLVLADASGASAPRTLAAYAARRWPGVRVAVVHDRSNGAFSEAWRQVFEVALREAGGRLAAAVPFTSGQGPSFGELAGLALAQPADAVLIVANALDTAMLAQRLKRRAPELQLLGTAWSLTEDLPQHGGAAVEGAVFVHRVDPSSRRPEAVRFRKAFADRYGQGPSFAAFQSYDVVRMLARALERDPTRPGVRRELLRRGAFRGLTEEFTLDPTGDAQRPDHLSTVRDGRLRRLE